jgi:membrane-bound ClpP family serine protease
MAANETHHGDQEISEQRATFASFVTATKWSSLVLGAGLFWLVVWFCTDAGFMAGAIAGVVVLILGFMLLRKKPQAAGAH